MATEIIFGMKFPKDWKENLRKQKDPVYQDFLRQWDKEPDPVKKDEIYRAMKEYWAKKKECEESK